MSNKKNQLSTHNTMVSSIDTDKIRALKTTIMPKNATNADLELFIEYCRRTQLDPFARQIYAIDIQGRLSIQTSIDGFRVIAQRTGEYRGQEVFWCDETGEWTDVWLSEKPPKAAKVLIYRDKLDKPVAGIALYREYCRETHMWKKMPATMLAKCAESLAFRKAFPNELSGLYTQEEMQQADRQMDKTTVDIVNNNSIDNSVYNIDTNTYSHGKIDYTIIPFGKNKDKKWSILNIEELFKSMTYFKGKNDINYINAIETIFEEKVCICPVGASKGSMWEELPTEVLEQYYKDYKEGKLIGYANEYAYYIENLLLERKEEEAKLGDLDEETNTTGAVSCNVSVTEDEDPFSDADGKDWDSLVNESNQSTNDTADDLKLEN